MKLTIELQWGRDLLVAERLFAVASGPIAQAGFNGAATC